MNQNQNINTNIESNNTGSNFTQIQNNSSFMPRQNMIEAKNLYFPGKLLLIINEFFNYQKMSIKVRLNL